MTNLDTIARAIHARITGDEKLWAVVDERERLLYKRAADDALDTFATIQLLRGSEQLRPVPDHSKSTASSGLE